MKAVNSDSLQSHPFRSRYWESQFVVGPSLRPRSEVVSSLTSPNRKWSISEEYEWRPSRFLMILRDSAGNQIASGNEHVVERYLIDEPGDWRSQLEITDETA